MFLRKSCGQSRCDRLFKTLIAVMFRLEALKRDLFSWARESAVVELFAAAVVEVLRNIDKLAVLLACAQVNATSDGGPTSQRQCASSIMA